MPNKKMLSNTARIAKNTLMLYFRQLLNMAVSLYTVRAKLEILGIEDFGIFNIVSGVVLLFTFLNGAMTSATQRFLNFALGRNDTEQARNVYSISFVIYAWLALIVVILAQTVGLWFFYNVLNIPPERQNAAFVVYQFTVVATVTGIFQVPYRATIVAYEKMSFFAVLSIIEAVLKLGIVLLLPLILFDHLMVYAFLVCIAGIVILLVYKIYCNRKLEVARFWYCKDKELFKQLLGFSGWGIFGETANIGSSQGTNILINIFHGVTVNAAMGIATQVNSAVNQFVRSFQTAFSPQITKSYSAKEYDHFIQLIFRTAKMSFCLLLFFALPLFINVDFVLQIWLINVPDYVLIFTQLILLLSLIDAICGPLWMAVQAAGDLKKYQLVVSCFVLANLPLSLLFLRMGFSPVWVLALKIVLGALVVIWTIFFLGKKVRLPVKGFFCEVVLPLFIIAGGGAFLTIFMQGLFISDWSSLVVSCIVSTISIGSLMYLIGLNRQEKGLLQNWVKIRIRKICKNNIIR